MDVGSGYRLAHQVLSDDSPLPPLLPLRITLAVVVAAMG